MGSKLCYYCDNKYYNWYVIERLSSGIYTLQNINTNLATGHWPGAVLNNGEVYKKDVCYINLANYNENIKKMYNAMSVFEADGGIDPLTEQYSLNVNQNGFYLIPYRKYCQAPNGTTGDNVLPGQGNYLTALRYAMAIWSAPRHIWSGSYHLRNNMFNEAYVMSSESGTQNTCGYTGYDQFSDYYFCPIFNVDIRKMSFRPSYSETGNVAYYIEPK